MKNFKQAAIAVMVLSSLSILAGCGKSKGSDNNTVPGIGNVSGGVIIPGVTLPNPGNVPGTPGNIVGNCLQIVPNSGQVQFTVAGQASIGVTGFSGYGTIGGAGSGGGQTYTRVVLSQQCSGQYYPGNSYPQNCFQQGDYSGSITTVSLNGQPGSMGSFVATVTLSQTTASALSYSGGSVCGVYFNNTALGLPNMPNAMYGPIRLVNQYGLTNITL